MHKFYKSLLVLGFTAFINQASAQLPAFPGAEGYAKFASGGRGGKVVEVTNLNDAGPGSFRQAFSEYPGEPITIVFRVGGTITLNSVIKVSRSNFTIAGQTAPGDGICLKGYSFILNGARAASQGGNHGNIIIRYLRSRPGGTVSTGLYGFDMENCQNVIVDHCSFSWANEECAAMYDTKNITVQWCIASEGLYNAGHAKGLRSYGGVWGGQFVSYHHNLIAHQNSRTVRFNGARAHDTLALIDYRNNVIYNWGSSGACYGGESEIANGYSRVNMVNNYYKPGPATPSSLKFVQASYTAANAKGIGTWYINGNTMHGNAAFTASNNLAVDLNSIPLANRDSALSPTPFAVDYPLTTTQTALDAFDSVLANAGAILPLRDATDSRVINETRTGTAFAVGPTSGKGGIIDLPANVGGWATYNTADAPADADHDGMPDAWELARNLNPNDASDRNNISSTSGYTMLEEYLNGISAGNTLPIGLLSFSAVTNAAAKTVVLKWETSEEKNIYEFIVERSTGGNSFVPVGKLAAKAGNGNKTYTFQDALAASGTVYYRLRIADKNGNFTSSNTLSVNVKLAGLFRAFPNPAHDALTVNHPAAVANTYLSVIGSDGKLLMQQTAAISATQTSLPVASLKNGSYLLLYKSEAGQAATQFIKK